MLTNIFASTPSISLEAENGTSTGSASVVSDASSSGQKAVAFKAPATPPPPSSPTPSPNPPPTGASKPVFIIYYLWWDRSHWTSHLGSNYPVNQSPNPLPATLDASSCGTVNKYSGNVMTDVSQGLAYDQSNYQTVLMDVRQAAATGAAGFAVNWVGTGSTGQSASSSANNTRLQYVYLAAQAVNANGGHFKVMINYQSSAVIRSMAQFTNDFNYLLSTYGNNPATDHTYSSKLEVVMAGTWKYPDSSIQTISSGFRSKMLLLGDEKPSTWTASRAQSLDGTSYYWSSQDPYANKASFSQIQQLGNAVHSTKNPDGSAKIWLAPFTPGYNAMLLYNTNTCVPRNNGQTMHALYDGNLPSNPDGWTVISWNEISEGSYIVPLTRYGNTYTNVLQNIMSTGK